MTRGVCVQTGLELPNALLHSAVEVLWGLVTGAEVQVIRVEPVKNGKYIILLMFLNVLSCTIAKM